MVIDRLFRFVLTSMALIATAGCASQVSDLPSGPRAYETIPAASVDTVIPNYRIGAFDAIDVTVFQEPDLSLKNVQVDSAGRIILPLIGSVQAAGATSTDLSTLIARKYEEKYLENPQVFVIVASSVSQKVTVEGSVNEAGVFEIKGRATLLEALALAKGPSRTAALDEVAVFRTIDGQRMGAVFDLAEIRAGRAKDPLILGNDVVVVGFSSLKAGFRDFLTAAPLISIFRPF